MIAAAALLMAWGVDAAFGEPRNAWHPVAWLGRLLAPLGHALCRLRPAAALAGGALAWLLLAAGLAAGAWALQQALPDLAGSVVAAMSAAAPDAARTAPAAALAAIGLALLLKPCFAWRMLREEVAAVEAALGDGLDAARARLARLVSRDVQSMDAAALRETAIETLAENLNDSLVAPLFWFALLGLPGAVLYRIANTADAMWGYRGRYEWAGKWAARADDVLSWLPARATALLLHWPATRADWRRLRREAARTPSPNGGWPMGAMALALDLRLGKPGVYTLHPGARTPSDGDVARALQRAQRAARRAVLACAALCLASAWAQAPGRLGG